MTLEEVFDHIELKRAEEHMYSRYAEEDGSYGVASTFHAFTKDGIELRNRPGV